jgi:hypothetical protein
MLVAAGIALVLAFSLDNSQAQTNAAPAPPPTVAVAPPKPAMRPQPRFRQPQPVYARAISDLRVAKMQLQRSTNDFEGHKDSAIQACDKAMEELQAVMKITIAEQPKEQPPTGVQAPGQPSAPHAAPPTPAPEAKP